jgi:hypothetical protein
VDLNKLNESAEKSRERDHRRAAVHEILFRLGDNHQGMSGNGVFRIQIRPQTQKHLGPVLQLVDTLSNDFRDGTFGCRILSGTFCDVWEKESQLRLITRAQNGTIRRKLREEDGKTSGFAL